jgi:hypothetical protein
MHFGDASPWRFATGFRQACPRGGKLARRCPNPVPGPSAIEIPPFLEVEDLPIF